MNINKQKTFGFLSYSVLVVISLLLAFLVVNARYLDKERNDMAAYQAHYECLGYGYSSIKYCAGLIGYPADYVYEVVAYSAGFLVGFSSFVFIVAFFIYFTILASLVVSSKYYLIPILFVLSDFRFYELGNNVLRNGLALSFILLCVFGRRGSLVRIIPVLTHASSLPYLLSGYIRGGYLVYLLGAVSAFLIGGYVQEIMMWVASKASSSLYSKIYAYFSVAESNSGLPPLTYLAVFFLGLVFNSKLKDNAFYLISFNCLFLFLICSVLLQDFGVGYRFLNFAVPFAAITLGCVFDYVSRRYGRVAFVSAFVSLVSLFLIVFFKNYEMVVHGFR